MEDTLGAKKINGKQGFYSWVLILVLMEDTLGVSQWSAVNSAASGINPCSNGFVLAPLFWEGLGEAPDPCSNGRYSRSE